MARRSRQDDIRYSRGASPASESRAADVRSTESRLTGDVPHSTVSSASGEKGDGSPPLVIDLPAGQKLLVGDLPDGTTIEIATWTGTSGPDNRTTRLLVGVARDGANADTESSDELTRTYSVKRRRHVRRGRMVWLSLLGTGVALGIIVLAILLSPLRFLHPVAGQSVGFGPPRSVVAVTVPMGEPKAGETVIAEDSQNQLLIGRIAATGKGNVLVQTDTGYTQVSDNRLSGSVVLIIPFIGYLM